MSIFSIVIFLLFIIPASLFIHELGHITSAKLRKADKIHLFVGTGKAIGNLSLFDIKLVIHVVYMFGAYTSTIRNKPFSNNEKVFITIMGPLFNGVLALLLYVTYNVVGHNDIILLTILFNLWLCIVNLIPYKFGMKQSDGFILYQLLIKQKATDKL